MASLLISMRQLLSSLVEHGKITTTEAQAKLVKRQVERLISRSKKLDLAARRRVLALLSGDRVAEKFLGQLVPQFQDRVGGYVRVVKLPHRLGDRAPLARVEFVEEIKPPAEKPTPVSKKVTRTRVMKTAAKKPAKRGKNGGRKNAKTK